MMQQIWLLMLPVVLLLLWLAWRRPNRQRLAWRLLASAVAGICLVLLVFPPTTRQAISPSTAILLTAGYNPDTLRHLLRQTEAKPPVYIYGTAAAGATPINSLYLLRQQQPSLAQVLVLGNGLEKADLQALQGVQVLPHLSDAAAGISAVHWPENVALGEAVNISGQYRNTGNTSSWLYLQAAGQLQDSVEVAADSTAGFTLRYTPKQAGQFIYAVLEKSGAAADTVGMVPVQVRPVQELGVLLLASSPLFEFRFLKNHLAEQQHRVALRTTVSKNLSQQEWLNMPRTPLDRLTPTLLEQFDVVITEPEALQQLSAGERAALERAVTEGGLGVLTIANAPATGRSTAFFTAFQTQRLSQQGTRSTRASWAENATATATASPYALVNTAAVAGVVAEQQQDRLLAGVKKAGWGKVALSLVPQTFPWKLEGQEGIYASYWANLLSAVAKQEVREKFWQLAAPQVPKPNQPLTLTFTDNTATGAAPSATVVYMADSAAVSLPLAQHPAQPAQFSGTFWPRRSGWYRVQTPDAPSYMMYVQDSTDWSFTTVQARQQATQAFVATQTTAAAPEAAAVYQEEPVSLIWFFLLFVLSSGFLWLEEKF